MRVLEHRLAMARGTVRRAVSRLGLKDPEWVQPARLVLRMDEGDLTGSLGDGEPLNQAALQRALIDAVEWLGPIPVTFLALESSGSHLVESLIRFAHRLECPTELVTAGRGIDREQAEALVDCGLKAVRVLVGGVSDRVQQSVIGLPAIEATDAVAALLAARDNRRAAMDIEVGIPWRGRSNEEMRAVVGWARQAGVDGYRVLAPWSAEDMPVDAELLDDMGGVRDGFNRTDPATVVEIHAMVAHQDGQPGAPRVQGNLKRRRFRCPVGGQRVELTVNGHLRSCPFKGDIAASNGTLSERWSQSRSHLQAIHSCDRMCAHVELAPQRVLG